MNIFNIYLDKIIRIVTDQNKKNLLKLPKKLDSINVDIPPKQFDCDISTNVSMVLAKINETNGMDLWSDLIRRLETETAGQRLVTDSITNYVLTAALQHEGIRRPKETWQKKKEFFNGDYKDKLLYYQVDDSLLIINQRDGGLSQNGRLSGHWPDNVLKVSRIYPDELMRFVNVRSSDFKLIWEGESVSIYKILRDPLHY